MKNNDKNTVIVNGHPVAIEGERNLLELIRKSGIDIPTFCYHSDLSVYGACRLCLVDVEGRGIQAACSTPPKAGMVILTHTEEIRNIRKIAVELILANHDMTCPTCDKSDACKLRSLAAQLGIDEIRFKKQEKNTPRDLSSPSLVRDPDKCVLCGDCVRYCSEVQSIGAIDFAHRGKDCSVQPAFGLDLADVECVGCGQCVAVCPTGALTIKSETDQVWKALGDPEITVVAQVAPAVRVALGELFAMAPGEVTTGKITAAMRRLGFNQVYDTAFSADLTVIEEANEFLKRKEKNENLPIFTSCCPAWVQFAEQYYPDLLPNLSTCKSPQQMFGAMAKEQLPGILNIASEKLYIVAVMPCTAKKAEAARPEFINDGRREVDAVISTQELGKMIKETGLKYKDITSEAMDMPFGLSTGAGVIFGKSGGVSEAVLRYSTEKLCGKQLRNIEFKSFDGNGIRQVEVALDDSTLKLAVVHGLKNARKAADLVQAGKADWDIIEIMACPGGCIGGAGQPVSDNHNAVACRCQGIEDADNTSPLSSAGENPFIQKIYKDLLEIPGSEAAHDLLHRGYKSRKRTVNDAISLFNGDDAFVEIKICVGTGCYLKGSQDLLKSLMKAVEGKPWKDKVKIEATFCMERCHTAPNARVNDEIIGKATISKIINSIEKAVSTEEKMISV
ncbi:[FeFe] hydrogenase, group A [bacterium]|nr:[FeFe] hydrogenase, group A [bacterium]